MYIHTKKLSACVLYKDKCIMYEVLPFEFLQKDAVLI